MALYLLLQGLDELQLTPQDQHCCSMNKKGDEARVSMQQFIKANESTPSTPLPV